MKEDNYHNLGSHKAKLKKIIFAYFKYNFQQSLLSFSTLAKL